VAADGVVVDAPAAVACVRPWERKYHYVFLFFGEIASY
jgi:hypothetical protein